MGARQKGVSRIFVEWRMVTYRIFIDVVAEAQEEVHALLTNAPAGTVVKQNFGRKPVVFGEDTYLQLDVALAGEHAADLGTRLKRRYDMDMQRIA